MRCVRRFPSPVSRLLYDDEGMIQRAVNLVTNSTSKSTGTRHNFLQDPVEQGVLETERSEVGMPAC